jgi:hypothetical protein
MRNKRVKYALIETWSLYAYICKIKTSLNVGKFDELPRNPTKIKIYLQQKNMHLHNYPKPTHEIESLIAAAFVNLKTNWYTMSKM